MAESWRTAIANSDETHIWIRGYDIAALMKRASFADLFYLLHRSRLPGPGEGRLVDAMLIAVADHGAGAPSCAAARLVASGNRQSLSAAVAAGLLAIGDEHGGAGSACMEMISAGIARTRSERISVREAARQAVAAAVAARRRLPGLGHRVHTADPRVSTLFDMAREADLAGEGIEFVLALAAEARTRIKPLPINVDGALAAVLHDLGFPPAAGQFLFMIGRVAGLTAEVAEEHARERPMRVRFPVTYDGDPPREME
jgi:citrate synthase